MSSIKRRYYYAWTIREIIIALGLHESIEPKKPISDPSFRQSLAQMTRELRDKDVFNLQEAVEARHLMLQIHDTMTLFMYWSKEKSEQLRKSDEHDHFNEPMIAS